MEKYKHRLYIKSKYLFNKIQQFHKPAIATGTALTWLVSCLSVPAQAAEMSLGNTGIQFNQDTTLESSFVESHGAYQSVFGVINLDTGEKFPLLTEVKSSDIPRSVFQPSSYENDVGKIQDFFGSVKVTVPRSVAQFRFKANTNYAFYLESTYKGKPAGTIYSVDRINPGQEQLVTFTGSPTELCGDGMLMAWDDTGSRLVAPAKEDRDFDDFLVQLRDTACAVGEESSQREVAFTPPVGAAVPIAGGTVAQAGALPAAVGGGGGFLGAGLGLLGAGAAAILGSSLGGSDDSSSNTPTVASAPVTEGVGGATDVPLSTSPGGGSFTLPEPIAGGVEPEPVPEPMTIVGSGLGIGFAALLRHKSNRKRKRDESDTP